MLNESSEKLFIGVVDDSDIASVITAVRDAGAVPVIFSLGINSSLVTLNDEYKIVTVGAGNTDIVIENANYEELIRYIAEITDITISTDFQLVIDGIRRDRNTVYIANGDIYYGFKKHEYECSALIELVRGMRSEFCDSEDNLKEPFWKGVYRSFMKPFKRGVKYEVERELDDGEITELYRKYDAKANKYNSIYRSSLFLRALLPLMATLALSFALNIETVFGMVVPAKFWGFSVIAFFLVQALFNYLIIALSNYVVKHKIIPTFTRSRYLAENLRVLSLTAPYSLPRIVNNRINFNDTSFSNISLNKEIERIRRNNFRLSGVIDSTEISSVASNIDLLIAEQIEYHENNSRTMDKCADYLMKIAKAFFIIGLIVVIGRGIYQSVIVMVDFNVVVNGIKLSDFFSKLFNVFALVVPAVTVMYMSLRQSLNIDNYFSRSMIMKDKLSEIKAALSDDMSCYELIKLVTVLNTLLIDEASDWYIATEQKRVSKM